MSDQPILAFAARLRPHDASVAIALHELVRRASPEGVVDRGDWIAGVRNAYDSELPTRDPAGEAAGMVPADQLARYLEQHVLRPLKDEGIAEGVPEGPDWERARILPETWAATQPDRDRVVARLHETAHALLAPTVEATQRPAPSANGNGRSTLEAKGLVKVFRRRRVVNDVDVRVTQGEIVGLLGPNGAGKTTTFYMVVGLIPPTDGEVFLDGENLTRTPMYRRARKGIGYLAQEPSIFRKLTVEENILAILQTLGIGRAERRERLEQLLDELSIKHLRKAKAYSLSGGERRRLEITRALVSEPKFMLLDEPFAGVDPIAVHDIQQIVAGLRHRGIGVIITDHNVEQTLDIVDRAYIMYDGRVRVSGTVAELVWNDEVAEIYFGPTLTARMRERYAQPEDV